MSGQIQINLQAQKLGALISAARMMAHKTVGELAGAIGEMPAVLLDYEAGRKTPSLPELEVIAFSLNLPISRFLSEEPVEYDTTSIDPARLPQLIGLRQRMISALIRQKRLQLNISIDQLSEETGISKNQLNSFESNNSAVPLSDLEAVLKVLGESTENLLDKNGPIGKWIIDQDAIQKFVKLPPELRSFVIAPENQPYLELAVNLSQLSTERLRAIAEGLLEITL